MLPPADTNDSTHNRRRRTARLRYVLLCMGVWAWGRGQVDGFGMRPSSGAVVVYTQSVPVRVCRRPLLLSATAIRALPPQSSCAASASC